MRADHISASSARAFPVRLLDRHRLNPEDSRPRSEPREPASSAVSRRMR